MTHAHEKYTRTNATVNRNTKLATHGTKLEQTQLEAWEGSGVINVGGGGTLGTIAI